MIGAITAILLASSAPRPPAVNADWVREFGALRLQLTYRADERYGVIGADGTRYCMRVLNYGSFPHSMPIHTVQSPGRVRSYDPIVQTLRPGAAPVPPPTAEAP